MALEVASPSPSGRCLLRSSSKTGQNAPWPAPISCARCRQECLHAGTTLFGMVNRPLTSNSCGNHAQANRLRTQTARNRFCTVALVAPVEIQALVVVLALPRVVATQGALTPMPPPSYSSALGPNSLPRASCNELPHTSRAISVSMVDSMELLTPVPAMQSSDTCFLSWMLHRSRRSTSR